MAFRINGGSFYPPLVNASLISGSTRVVSRPQGSVQYSPAQAGVVSFASASYVKDEGTILTFSVGRAGGAGGSIAVDYAIVISEGGPTSGATGTIVWNSAESGQKVVNVQLGLVTATRNGTITLSNARTLSGGAAPSIGGTNPASLQIVNVVTAPVVDVTTFSVEGSGIQLVSFGSTFKVGDIPAGQVPMLTDNANTVLTGFQSQVTASHPDGSVRHAMMHGTVTGGQNYKIRAGNAATGTAKTVAGFLAAVSGSIARVLVTGGLTGTCDLRDLLSSSTNRAILSQGGAVANLRIIEAGPNVLTVRVAQNVGTHLRVNFEVSWYGGTVFWVDAWAVNGYGNLNGQGAANYTGQMEVNGTLQPAVPFTTTTHKNHTAWHASSINSGMGFWSGQSGSPLYVRHNTAYLQATRAVPNYRRLQVPSDAFKNALPQTCAPMDNCEIPDAIDATGPGGHIGLIPQWDANYLKSDGDIRCFRNVMANTDGSAAHSVWLLSSLTGEFMTEVEFPNTSWNQQTGYGSGCFTGLGFGESAGSSHLPSIGFLAYILTGRQFHLDAMNAWVTLHNMWQSIENDFTYQGKTYRRYHEPTLRGVGWQERSNAQAAYINPDTHFHKAYTNKWLEAVVTTYDIPYYGPGGSRRVTIGGAYCAEGNNDYRLFFHLFWQASLSYACLDLGFSLLLPVAKYAGILVAGMFGNTGEFLFEVAPRQSLKLGPTDNTATADTDVFYSSFTEVRAQNAITAGIESGTSAAATFASNFEAGPDHTGSRNETIRQNTDPTGYFANFLGSLSYLHGLGIDGGLECYVRGTLSAVQPDFTNVGQFDIGIREVDIPAYIRNAPVMTWTQIASTLMSSATPANYPGDPSARVYAWGGMCIKMLGSEIRFIASGGHGDSNGNDVTLCRLNQATPVWLTERAPDTPTNLGQAYFSNGKPASRHIYHDCQFYNGLNQGILHGCTFTGPQANAFDTVSAFSPALGDYLPAATYANSAGSAGIGAKAVSWSSGCIYYVTGGSNMRFARWSPVNGTTIIATPGGFGEAYKCAAVNPIDGVFLHARDNANGPWRSYSIDTGASTVRSPETTPGLTAGQQSQLISNGGSLEWDVRGRRYLYYVNSEVFAINRSTYAATPLVIAGTPPPASTPNGVFSRFRYVPELDICVAITNYGNNIHFFKFGSTQRAYATT